MSKISIPVLGQLFDLLFTANILSPRKIKERFRFLLLALILPAAFISGMAHAEPVIWTNLVNATATGNTLAKSVNTNSWDSGGSSQQSISGDGAFEFTAVSVQYMAVGLSYSDVDVSMATIDYCMYMAFGHLYIEGVQHGDVSAGDVVRIERNGTTVTYLVNGVLRFTSTIPSSGSLFLDASFRSWNAKVLDAQVIDITPDTVPPVISGVTADNNAETSLRIRWTTDEPSTSQVSYGISSSSEQSTVVDTNLVTSHSVTLSGLSSQTSYLFQVTSADGFGNTASDGDYSAMTTAPLPGSVEAMVWPQLTCGADVVGNSVTFTYVGYPPPGWAGCISQQTFDGDGAVEFTLVPGDKNLRVIHGLSTQAVTVYNDINNIGHGFQTGVPGDPWSLKVIENGNYRGTFGTYAAGDVLRIERIGGTIRYLRNGVVLYTNPFTSTGTLKAHVALWYNDTQVKDAFIYDANGTPDTFPPAITAVDATNITTTSATITWTTDEPTTSQVSYGIGSSSDQSTGTDTTMVMSHSVTLTGLTPATNYFYKVTSTDASSNAATSADFTFTTVTPDTTPPVISAITSSNITTSEATITWITDEPSTSRVTYGTNTSSDQSTIEDTTLVTSHSVTLTGLTSDTIYLYQAVSVDASGNAANSADNNFTTAPPDITPPVITAVGTTDVTATTATITWTTDEPSTSQVSYGTNTSSDQSTPVDSTLVTAHSVTLTGLTPGYSYLYKVVSTDVWGNTATSADFNFTTEVTVAGPAPVSWTNMVNATATGNTLAKSVNTNSWDSGGSSQQSIPGDGAFEFTAVSVQYMAVGLSYSDVDVSMATIDYCMYMAFGHLYIEGAQHGDVSAGDVVRIERNGTTITYLVNGVLRFTSTIPSSGSLFLDASFRSWNAKVVDAYVINGTP